jgi:hypothetical protein
MDLEVGTDLSPSGERQHQLPQLNHQVRLVENKNIPNKVQSGHSN